MPLPSLDEMLTLVVEGCLAGGETAAQTRVFIEAAMMKPDAPTMIQALGDGLTRVLDGKRGAEATTDLPYDVAAMVNVVLRAIGTPSENGA